MSVAVAAPAFAAGAVISLAVSWLLVSRLERVGERLGLSEALLGLVAALAADAPEVTAAVTAIAGHQQRLGAGVVIGSNVFNLAALLGLGAVVAGRIRLHRKVVVLGGAVAMWVAAACLAVVLGPVPPVAGLAAASGAVALYAIVLGAGEQALGRLPLPRAWISWLRSAVAEEELELKTAIRPQRARRQDAAVAAGSLLVVVAASVMMERAASALGSRFAVPEIVVGALVLAAVTSLPNAVAAVWLAARGRGAATLSTALNSNALNITIGLLLPAAVIGLGRPDSQTTLIAAWYAGLTAVVLAFAYRDRGIGRAAGIVVIAAYLVFAGSLLASAYTRLPQPRMAIAAGLTAAVAFAALLAPWRRHPRDHKAPADIRFRRQGPTPAPLAAGIRPWPCPGTRACPGTLAASVPGHTGIPAARLAGQAAVGPRPGADRHGRRRRRRARGPRRAHRAAHHRALQRAPDRAVGAHRHHRTVGNRPGRGPRHSRPHLGHHHPPGLPRRRGRGGNG